MPVPAAPRTTGLLPSSTPPPVIAIPGTKRPTARCSACNPATCISAYVVLDKDTRLPTALTIALKRKSRIMGLTLKGHKASIVDLEFLQTPAGSPIHVLGTCDRDGVVFLWFLYVAVDALGIEVGLSLLKKYSFFTLRRVTTAYYSRIRMAGTVESGTMVLVPNDGAVVRVVNFQCEASHPDGGRIERLTAGAEETKALPAPPLAFGKGEGDDDDDDIDDIDGNEGVTGQDTAGGDSAKVADAITTHVEYEGNEVTDTHTRDTDAGPFQTATHLLQPQGETVVVEEHDDDDDDDGVPSSQQSTQNSLAAPGGDGMFADVLEDERDDSREILDNRHDNELLVSGMPIAVTEMEGALERTAHEPVASHFETAMREMEPDEREYEAEDEACDDDEDEEEDAEARAAGVARHGGHQVVHEEMGHSDHSRGIGLGGAGDDLIVEGEGLRNGHGGSSYISG